MLLARDPAHGSLITPDAGAAALGVAGSYLFWRWLDCPNWSRAVLAGLVLGLIELTKMTWLILFGLWPALGLLWVVSSPTGRRAGRVGLRSWRPSASSAFMS